MNSLIVMPRSEIGFYTPNLFFSEIQSVASSETFFYPKESTVYRYDGQHLFGLQLCFRAQNKNALFYSISTTAEGGRAGLALHSEFLEETRQFLTQNNIPIRGFGSDCQFSERALGERCWGASYYTYDPEVCIKLATILLKMNRFDKTGLDEKTIKRFLTI